MYIYIYILYILLLLEAPNKNKTTTENETQTAAIHVTEQKNEQPQQPKTLDTTSKQPNQDQKPETSPANSRQRKSKTTSQQARNKHREARRKMKTDNEQEEENTKGNDNNETRDTEPAGDPEHEVHFTVSGAAGQPRPEGLRRPNSAPQNSDRAGPPENTKIKNRNTNRGIRNEDKVETRNKQRSMKRNRARRETRNKIQDKHKYMVTERPVGLRNHDNKQTVISGCKIGQNIRIKYGPEYLNLLNLNTQGLKRIEKRTLIEQYMKTWKIDFAVITETHINTNHVEIRKEFTWYFSGGDTKEHHFAGVAIVIRNKWKNSVEDIQPINERIIYITLSHTIPITIIGAYAPTAEATPDNKDKFYSELDKLLEETNSNNIVHLLGDMNARIQIKQGPHEDCIGTHTFNKENVTLEKQSEEIEDNRLRFINLCVGNNLMIMNTTFQKPEHKLITWKTPGTRNFTFMSRPHFEMIDYHCTQTRWKNTVKNIETDIYANITSDHYPQWSTIQTKLQAITKQRTARPKYIKCTDQQRSDFNHNIEEQVHNQDPSEQHCNAAQVFTQQIYKAAGKCIPMVNTPAKSEDISQESLGLIKKREESVTQGNEEKTKEITKLLRIQRRQDKQNRIQQELSNKLDVRDWWAVIKKVKKQFSPMTYALKDRQGKRIPKKQRAEESAKHLEQNIWGLDGMAKRADELRQNQIVENDGLYNVDEIQMQELNEALKKFKRRKSPGPDEIAMELYKELNSDNRRKLLLLINDWWTNENMTAEVCKARVVMIFKKGDSSKLENYRPISLLNGIYKIFTAILVKRIEQNMDKQLHKTQFGFRKNKSTNNALFLVRRLIDIGERSQTKVYMILLDWEKAFDKLSHDSLFLSMKRMGVDEKLINLVKMLYKDPTFFVEIEGDASTVKRQHTGIRQGCPMSPYLFLIAMTAIFADVKEDMKQELIDNRVVGAEFDEILFADDTILVSESRSTLEKYLQKIEEVSGWYGMRLNKSKCEAITINGRHDAENEIYFLDKTKVPQLNIVKYLGCMVNDKGDPRKEISKRISECMVILKQLDPCWKHTENPTRWKLIIFDAVVRSKLMYGLESAQLNDSLKNRLDVFQLKGLRKILGLNTTFVNRENTNELVYNKANEELNKTPEPTVEMPNPKAPKQKHIMKLSEYYESCRRLTALDVIANRHNKHDPRPQLTMNTDNLSLNEYEKKRCGRPKNVWWHFAIKNIWTWIGSIDTEDQRHPNTVQFDEKNTSHQEEIKRFTETHGHTLWSKKRKRSDYLNPI